MRIFVTSDLHFGQSKEMNVSVRAVANHLRNTASSNDVLLLGGDYGNTDAEAEACLRFFESFPGHVLAVPGNHDVWVEGGDTSPSRLRRFRQTLECFGMHSLHHGPAFIGGMAFVGSLGWYDYSFRDEIGISRAYYEAKRFGVHAWRDADCVKWPVNDVELTDAFTGLLESHLRSAEKQNPSEIIGLIHHVPVKRLLPHPRFLVPKEWRFLNAFLGAERFGDLFTSFGVRQVFCGHIHLSKRVRRHGTVFQSIGVKRAGHQVLVYDSEFKKTSSLWITSS